ncbi:MAG: hypothetical protein EPN19_13025, partial [Betaproteobacteria bacterium]
MATAATTSAAQRFTFRLRRGGCLACASFRPWGGLRLQRLRPRRARLVPLLRATLAGRPLRACAALALARRLVAPRTLGTAMTLRAPAAAHLVAVARTSVLAVALRLAHALGARTGFGGPQGGLVGRRGLRRRCFLRLEQSQQAAEKAAARRSCRGCRCRQCRRCGLHG